MREKIYQVIRDALLRQDIPLDDNTSLDDLELDSLDKVEICMNLEDAFKIALSEDDALGLLTIGDIVKIVERETGHDG